MAATSSPVPPRGNSRTAANPSALAALHRSGTGARGIAGTQVSARIPTAARASAALVRLVPGDVKRLNPRLAATDSASAADIAKRAGARTPLLKTGSRISHAYGGS